MTKLKNILNQKGLRQVDLVKMTNLSKVTISDLVNGKYEPSLKTAILIADALSIDVRDLAFGEGRTLIPVSESDDFGQITRELHELYHRKNADYGDSFAKSYQEYGQVMLGIRLEDKLNRLKTLSKADHAHVKEETMEDTLKDLANYAIMGLMELRRESNEN